MIFYWGFHWTSRRQHSRTHPTNKVIPWQPENSEIVDYRNCPAASVAAGMQTSNGDAESSAISAAAGEESIIALYGLKMPNEQKVLWRKIWTSDRYKRNDNVYNTPISIKYHMFSSLLFRAAKLSNNEQKAKKQQTHYCCTAHFADCVLERATGAPSFAQMLSPV